MITAVLAATLAVGALAVGAAPVSASQAHPSRSAECTKVLEELEAEYGEFPLSEDDRARYLEMDAMFDEINEDLDDALGRLAPLVDAQTTASGALITAEAAVVATEQAKAVSAAALTAAEAALAAALEAEPDGSDAVDEATAARDAARSADEDADEALAAAQATRSAATADLAAAEAATTDFAESEIDPLEERVVAILDELGVERTFDFTGFIELVQVAEAACEDTTHGGSDRPAPVTRTPKPEAPVAKPVTVRATFTG